jgi:polyamine oxidase
MPRTPRKLQTRTDYLILGGGIAGVAALAEAKRRGINAIGLEAKCRVGGRIRTAWDRRVARYPIELGAEFVHGPAMRKLCESLGLTLIRHPSDGDAFVDGQFLPLKPVLEVFARIRQRAAEQIASGHTDQSVEEFLEAFVGSESDLPAGITRHLLLQLIRNDFATRVSELGLFGLVAPDVDGYEDNYRVAEGYAEVPRRLAVDVDVRTNHAATAIMRYRDEVHVLTNRGVFVANVVFVCLPLGVLQAGDVTFDPQLSDDKSAAIQSMSAGMATKLVLAFRRTRKGTTFWPPTTPLLATSLATQLWWPTGWGHDNPRTFLASCLVGGPAVERFADRDPREVGLLQLAHMFGRDRVFPKALQWHQVKAWHADPRIKGGYSSVPAGADADLLKHLESIEDESNPQLVFAGDYVSRHPGSVHCAYQSGTDAVKRAVAARIGGFS